MQAAKDRIQELIYELRKKHSHPKTVFDIGFVGYRDYGSSERHIVFDFTEAEALVRYIRPIQPKDGDDEAEDVAWGLFHASNLNWAHADIRLVYHIGDAPAHGDFFTRGHVSDRFPEGDPDFLDPRQIIKEWAQQGYHYTFVRINRTTDTMVQLFHDVYTSVESGSFRVIDLSRRGPDGFLETICESVDETLTQHTASQGQAEETGNPKQPSCSSH